MTQSVRESRTIVGDDVAVGPIDLAAPPRHAENSPMTGSIGMVLMPVASGMGAVLLAVTSQGRPLMAAIALLVLAASIAMGVLMLVGSRTGDRRRIRQERERYLDHLDRARTTARRAAAGQRTRAASLHPNPRNAADAALFPDPRWARRPSDPDFFCLRVGIGTVPTDRPVRLPIDPGDPLGRWDPVCLAAATDLAARHTALTDQPVVLRWKPAEMVWITGDGDDVAAAARALLAQLMWSHSPDDVGVLVCCAEPEQWQWLKWLPHSHSRRVRDGPIAARMITSDPVAAVELLQAETDHHGVTDLPAARTLLLVIDRTRTEPTSATLHELVEAARLADVRQLHLLGPGRQEPSGVGLRIAVGGSVEKISGGGIVDPLPCRVDRLDAADAAVLARFFAPLPAEGGRAADLTPMVSADPHVMDVAALDPAVCWLPRARATELCAPIGTRADGSVMVLDLKESSQGGMGPHGLVVGATGSGKSELLRTLVASLVIGHSPQTLALLLADFKGGATFAGLARLPHLAGMVTNLDADLTLVDRFRDALGGEVQRRQELFAAAGGVTSLDDYVGAREARPELEHVPRLLVIVDEFSEMLGARPDLADVFITIGRIGRSIGVHLLLATQRLDIGRTRGLESHLSYRICLRTFSEAESREAIGAPDAYHLPVEPGWAYLMSNGPAQRFRAASVSRPYRPRTVDTTTAEAAVVLPFETENGLATRMVELATRPATASAGSFAAIGAGSRSAGIRSSGHDIPSTVLEVTVDRLSTVADKHPGGRRVRPIWLPPLPARLTLSALLGLAGPDVHPDKEPTIPGPVRSARTVPSAVLGLVDIPERQRQEALLWSTADGNGNLLIVGAARTGASTAAATLLVSLALRWAPSGIRVMAIDLGGGRLAALSVLPHVAAVATRSDGDLIRRVLATTMTTIDQREALQYSAEDVTADGGGPTVNSPGHLLLVIDGWAGLLDLDPGFDDQLEQILRRGPRHGVHAVMTAATPSQLRARIAAGFGSRIELRLADPFDSVIDRGLAKTVPAGRPGRAIVAGRHFAQIALPILTAGAPDGRSGNRDEAETEEELGVPEIVELLRRRWPGQQADPIRTLPAIVTLSELQADIAASGQEQGGGVLDGGVLDGGVLGGGVLGGGIRDGAVLDGRVLIGLGEHDLRPVSHNLLGDDPHLLICGDGGAGKTTMLRSLLTQLVGSPGAIAVVDHRRRLRLPAQSETRAVLRTATNPEETAALCSAVSRELTDRRARCRMEKSTEPTGTTFPPLYLLVDDLDLVAGALNGPLDTLVPFLSLGRDLGFHLIVARRTGGLARAQYGPVLQSLGDLGTPLLLLSGSPTEGRLAHGLLPRALPAGRAQFAGRWAAPLVVQTPLPE